jgi:dienelactone hydrolase
MTDAVRPDLVAHGQSHAGEKPYVCEELPGCEFAAAKKSEFVIYPDAPHAFHADYRPSFRKEAAEDGWKRCVAWFKANGVA